MLLASSLFEKRGNATWDNGRQRLFLPLHLPSPPYPCWTWHCPMGVTTAPWLYFFPFLGKGNTS